MEKNTKIILGVLVGLLVICLCLAVLVVGGALVFLRQTVAVSPVRVETASDAIAEFDLPQGWRTDYAFQVGEFRLVGYRPEDGVGHIVLAQLPGEARVNVEELEREVRKLADGRGHTWTDRDMTIVERKQLHINGQPVELVIAEGRNSNRQWRQAMTAFQGRQGMTLAIYGVPIADWNQVAVDAFFASLR